MLLWTKNRLDGESEHCHIEKVTRDNNNENCHSEPSVSYKCHICNVNVPTMCYEKHNESLQHETIKKIFQKVLEGVSKQININTIHNKQSIGKDVYYCAPCSKIVKIENKQKHEDGDYHAKSVNNLIITNEFYKILKEKESEVNKKVLCEVNEASLGEVGDFETDRLKANDISDINNLNLEVSSSVLDTDDDYLADIQTPVQREMFETMNDILNEQTNENFEEYLKGVIKKFNLNVNLPVVNGEFIAIVAPNGDTVQVSREHFHSYREIGDDQIYCQLCVEGMSKDTRLHDVSEVHVRNIFSPINDKFARCVDSIWSHCVPCNKMVFTESNYHTFNDGHKQMIKDTQTPETGKTFCKECNLYVDTYNFSVHLNSKNHLSEFKQKDLAKKTNDSTVLSNRNNDSTLISNSNSATTEINNQNNAPTDVNNQNNVPTEIDNQNNAPAEINNQNNAPIEINNQSTASTTNNESPVVDIKISMLCTENQNDIKPTENKVEIASKPSSANTGATDTSASTSGINDIETNTSLGSSTVTINSIDSDHSFFVEASTSTKNESGVVDIKVNDSKLCSENQNDIKPTENKVNIDTKPSSANTDASDTGASTSGINDTVANTSPGSSTVTTNSIVSDNEDEKIEQNTSPGSITETTISSGRGPSDTYKCHICNVNVPTMCYEKHNESDQHETIKKIYQKVLEGVSKQININTIHNKQDIDKDVYYCAPCSKLIKTENKKKHEDGEYHAKSVNDLIITNGFYEILKKKESYDESEVNKKVLCEVNKAALGDMGDFETARLKANDYSDINNLNLEVSSSVLDSDDDSLADIQTPVQREMFETMNEQKKQSFEEYLKEVIKKFNLNVNLPVVNGEFISIVAPNGDRVQVSREHFHSYREVKENGVYCQLCNKGMSKDTSLHDVSENHVRNIFRPINDKFARCIDAISSHCVPCNNTVFTEYNHHTFNDDHKKNIKDKQTPKTGKKFCIECNLYVDTSVHLNSKKNLSEFKQKDLAKKPNESIVLSNRSNDSTIISNSNNAPTDVNNQNNAPAEINNQNNASIEINNQSTASTTNNEFPVVDIKISMLCSENQNDSKPTENKLEIATKPSSANTGAGTSGINDIETNTSLGSSTVTTNSNFSDHEDEKLEQNASSGSITVAIKRHGGSIIPTRCSVTPTFFPPISSGRGLSDSFKCHICNVNVPTMYYEKHNESNQHETIKKKIYQKLAEGVSEQININTIHNKQDVGKDVYCCIPCSKVIKIESKKKHEDGEYHAKSVKDLIITNESYEIVKEKESYDESEVNKTVLCEVNEAAFGEVGDLETNRLKANDADVINNLNLEVSSSMLDDDYISFVADIVTPIQRQLFETKNDEEVNEQELKIFKKKIREVLKKFNLNVPVVNGESISIVAPNGDTLQVSLQHYHSYIEVEDDKIYCQLCNKKWMSKYTRFHSVSEDHLRNIFKPIDGKFARQVDTISSHCIPCNEIVLTESDHTTINDVHKKNVKDTQTPKTDKTFCKECNLYVDTHNFFVHLNSKKHLSGLKQNSKLCKICNLTVSKNAWKKHTRTKKHLAKKTNDSIVLSNKSNDSTTISNSNNASTEIKNQNNAPIEINNQIHASTSTHNDSLAVHIKVNDSRYCELCKVNVPKGGMKIHVDGKLHKKVVSKLCSENQNDIKPTENKVENGTKPSSTNTRATDTGASTSGINDIVANTSPGSSTDTTWSIVSEREAEKISAYYDLTEFVDETRTVVRCKICSVFFGVKNIIEHMEGKNHKKNAHTKDAHKQKIKAYYKLLFDADDEKTQVKCEICDVGIPYVEKNIIEHMEGRNHLAAENELLKFHLVTRESSEFICECCDIRITDYLDHINSKTHTIQLLEKNEIDKNEMRKYVYDDNVFNAVARRHRELYRNLLNHNGIYKIDDTSYYCGVCRVTLSRISEMYHVLGERHVLEFKKC